MAEREDRDEGLAIQRGGPTSREELLEQLEELGIEPQRSTRFGSRPTVDRSSPVQPTGVGAPIVEAARALRARRRGEEALLQGATEMAASTPDLPE